MAERFAVNKDVVGSIPTLGASFTKGNIMTDNEFINELVKNKTVQWVDNYPWSGFRILNTCLVLRQSNRGAFNEKEQYYEFDWYISTWAFNIVVKTISEGNLSEAWPTNMEELDKLGLKLNEKFRNTDDF